MCVQTGRELKHKNESSSPYSNIFFCILLCLAPDAAAAAANGHWGRCQWQRRHHCAWRDLQYWRCNCIRCILLHYQDVGGHCHADAGIFPIANLYWKLVDLGISHTMVTDFAFVASCRAPSMPSPSWDRQLLLGSQWRESMLPSLACKIPLECRPQMT